MKATPKSEPKLTALVSDSVLDQIEELARWHHVSPAVLAGYLVRIGDALLSSSDAAMVAGAERADFIWQTLCQRPKRKSNPLPIAPSADTLHAAENRASWVSRPLGEWMGQVIELALPHFKNKELAVLMMGDPINAAVNAAANGLRDDYEEDPEMLARLDLPRESPFSAFERGLAREVAR